MPRRPSLPPRLWLLLTALTAGALTATTVPGIAAADVGPGGPPAPVVRSGTPVPRPGPGTGSPFAAPAAGGGETDLAETAAAYSAARSAPATTPAPAAALLAARGAAAAMPVIPATWTEQTRQPYDAQPKGYTDPLWSNVGTGFGVVSGRITALATDRGVLFAGAADGGVWASADAGGVWQPLTDDAPTLSIGALAVDPADHSLWVGTGEANTNADSYLGTGVYRLDLQTGQLQLTAGSQVGGSALLNHQVYAIRFDGAGGVYAATDRGLYRTTSGGGGTWTRALAPDPTDPMPPYANHVTSVAVRPGTAGRQVVAVNGWRLGAPGNGFYRSTDSGATFRRVVAQGLDNADIGRTTLAYASDGRLYALIQSPAALNAGAPSTLKGFYVSRSGDPAGPWTLLADATKLENSGSALTPAVSPTYLVGIQSWYNQSLVVDPTNPDLVFVGLEEVFRTGDGGRTFSTASPYWNLGLACGSACPPTTHPDQHASLLVNGQIVIGNDGGVYRRPAARSGYGGWTDLNATLHTLQFYDARGGVSGSSLGFWGGMQDNGTGLFRPGTTGIEPAGGDGFYVVVDPADTNRMVGEYTNGATYATTDGGHSFTTMSPTCQGQRIGYGVARPDCDPNARFATPLTQDPAATDHWVLGGQYVWDTTAGWATVCTPGACTWSRQYDLGTDHAATAVSTSGSTTYAAWTGGGGNPGPAFSRGVATNAGGSWHQLPLTGLPNRYIQGVTVDPADPQHAFVIFNGYSRRWIPGGGQGVVFETHDGGASWADLTGNLPDAPGDALVLGSGRLALATDVGVFAAAADQGAATTWARVGDLPHTAVDNLTVAPGQRLVAATHGRGIWTLTP
ncbi:MAG: hypothetical protein JWM67_570 [Mycobacterium sp.]|nr:hypothetical protein [Mycobacterium sp.]